MGRGAEGTGVHVVAYMQVSADKRVVHGLGLRRAAAKLAAYAALYELDLMAIEIDAGVGANTLQRQLCSGP